MSWKGSGTKLTSAVLFTLTTFWMATKITQFFGITPFWPWTNTCTIRTTLILSPLLIIFCSLVRSILGGLLPGEVVDGKNNLLKSMTKNSWSSLKTCFRSILPFQCTWLMGVPTLDLQQGTIWSPRTITLHQSTSKVSRQKSSTFSDP